MFWLVLCDCDTFCPDDCAFGERLGAALIKDAGPVSVSATPVLALARVAFSAPCWAATPACDALMA